MEIPNFFPEQPKSALPEEEFASVLGSEEIEVPFDPSSALVQEKNWLERLGRKTQKLGEIFVLISALVAGGGLASTAFAQEKPPVSGAQKESEAKKRSLPEVVFQAEIDSELFAADPLESAFRYRSPYNLKDERLLDVPPEGQIIFYKNSLEIYGVGEESRQINVSRVSHELFHQQFDQLSREDQDKIVDYFLKKYDFEKIKSYLVNKSSAYQDGFEKAKKYEDGEGKARRFIINEFMAHSGGFKEYTPDEPVFLIDILSDQADMLSQYGFSLDKQQNLKLLLQKGGALDQEEKKKVSILQEELNRAKTAAQPELQEEFTKNPEVTYEIKADAAATGRAYNRFDSDYFEFKAKGLDLGQDDLGFLKQYGFSSADITEKAKEILKKMKKAQSAYEQEQIKK